MAKEKKKKQKQKKSLVRKMFTFSVRSVFYLCSLLLLVLVLLLAWLQSPWFEDQLINSLRSGLQSTLENPADIADAQFDLFGRRLVIHGLRIESLDTASGAALLEVPSMVLHLSFLDILQSKLTVRNLIVASPEVDIHRSENGIFELLTFKEETKGGLDFDVSVEAVELLGGTLRVQDQEFGFSGQTGNLKAEFQGINQRYAGLIRIRDLGIRSPGMLPMAIDMDLDIQTSQEQTTVIADVSQDSNELVFSRIYWRPQSNELTATFDAAVSADFLDPEAIPITSGSAEISGELWYTDGNWRVESTLDATDITLSGNYIEYLFAQLTFENDVLQLNEIRTGTTEGDFVLAGSIADLFSTPQLAVTGSMRTIELERIFSSLDFTALQADSRLSGEFQATADLTDLTSLKITAEISGQANEELKELWAASVEDLRTARVDEILHNAVVPLEFTLNLAYENGVLNVLEGSHLLSQTDTVQLRGEFSLENFRLRTWGTRVDSIEAALMLANLDRWFGEEFPTYPQVFGVATFFRNFECIASFELDLRGPAENMTYDLSLDSSSISFVGHPLGAGGGSVSFAGTTISIDDLLFDIQPGSLDIGGTVVLPPAGTPPDVPPDVNLKVKGDGLPLAKLAWTIDPESLYGLEGEITTNLDLYFRDPLYMSGTGEVTLSSFHSNFYDAREIAFSIDFGDTWDIKDLAMSGIADETLAGTLEINPNTLEWASDLELKNFNFTNYADLLGEDADAGGFLDATIKAQGELLAATGRADFSLKDFSIQGVDLGNISGRFDADGRNGQLTLDLGEDEIVLQTQVLGQSFDRLQISLAPNDFELGEVLLPFVPDQRLYIYAYDGMTADLALGDEGLENVRISLANVYVGIEQFSVSSPLIQVSIQNDQVILEDVTFTQGGNQSVISLTGRMGLDDIASLDLKMSGDLNLIALTDILPDFSFSGTSQINLGIGGTLEAPLITGRMEVRNGFTRHRLSNVALEGVNGTVKFAGENLEFTRFSARVSGGTMQMDGQVAMNWASLEPYDFRFSASGQNILSEPMEGLEIAGGGQLSITGNLNRMTVAGDVNVNRASYTRRFDPEAEFTRFSQVQPLQLSDRSLEAIDLDIGIHAEEGIIVDNNFADMEVAIDLRISGTLANPGVTGRTEVLRGEVFYRDRKYDIESGVIEFLDPNAINPEFDFRAQTQVKNYRIYLNLHGGLDRMYPELSSEPALGSLDIFNLLAVGQVRDNPAPRETEDLQFRLMQLGLSGFLTKQITGEVERRAEELFGIDRLRLDPFLLEDTENIAARLTVGDQITDDLAVIYSTNLSRDDKQVLLFEYRLSPSLLLIGTREEDGSYAVDVHMRHQFK